MDHIYQNVEQIKQIIVLYMQLVFEAHIGGKRVRKQFWYGMHWIVIKFRSILCLADLRKMEMKRNKMKMPRSIDR